MMHCGSVCAHLFAFLCTLHFGKGTTHAYIYTIQRPCPACVSWLSGRMCLGWTQQATYLNLKEEVSWGEAATQRSGVVSECQSTETLCKMWFLQHCDWSVHVHVHECTRWTDATHFNGKSITGKTSSPRLKNAQYGFKWGVCMDGPGRHNNCGVIGLESIIIRFAPRRRDMVCLLATWIHYRRRAVSFYNKRSCTVAPANSLTPPPHHRPRALPHSFFVSPKYTLIYIAYNHQDLWSGSKS